MDKKLEEEAGIITNAMSKAGISFEEAGRNIANNLKILANTIQQNYRNN